MAQHGSREASLLIGSRNRQYEEVHIGVQKYPRQLLRSMQQFVFEEHLDILCSEDEIEIEELMELARDEFITSSFLFRINQANSSSGAS